jgi:ADP-ribose pyrophosphatase YjhB (NUDIX family)
VVTLIERDGFVLLGKRTEGSFRSGAWCLPGGFMEWSEDYLSAARREVREETGLEVKVRSILSVVSNFLSPHLHTLVIVLLATPSGGAERAGDDVSRLAWYPLGGPLPELAFEADLHIIERYAADRVAGAPVDPSHAG